MKKNLILLLVTIVFMLILSEIILTVFLRREIRPYRLRNEVDDNRWLNQEPYLLPGEDNTWEVAKRFSGNFNTGGTITTNRYGFRTSPLLKDEEYDRINILCLGDSMTFGFPLDDHETWPYYLGKIFSESGQEVRVVNAGYSGGFTLDTAYLELKDRLIDFKPAVVIYGVYPGNDYGELGIWRQRDPDGLPVQIDDLIRLTCGFYRVPVLRESCLFVALARVFNEWRYGEEESGLNSEEKIWEKISLVVRGFRKIADREGIKLGFVFLHSPYQDDIVGQEEIYVMQDTKKLEEYNRRLKQILRDNNITYVDDYYLILALKKALKHNLLPRPRPELEDDFKDLVSPLTFAPQVRPLASPDGEHNSALMNIYIAGWLYSQLGY